MGVVGVVLVPWRPGDELREQTWDIVRPRHEALGYSVFLGDSEGPWARGAAINAAALAAGNWDVALIADADTVGDPAVISKAMRLAVQRGGAVRPHDTLWRLTPSGSIAFAKDKSLEGRHKEGTQLGGGLLAVSREAWDRAGPYDDRFVGWGHEDTALNIALALKADWDRIPGEAWHLWHPEERPRTPEYRRNRSLMQQLRRDHRHALAQVSARKGYDLAKIL